MLIYVEIMLDHVGSLRVHIIFNSPLGGACIYHRDLKSKAIAFAS